MISLSFKIVLKEYKLSNPTKDKIPELIFGFNECVDDVSNDFPNIVKIKLNDSSEYHMSGVVNNLNDIKDSCLYLEFYTPQLDDDKCLVYHRESECVFEYLSDIKIGDYILNIKNRFDETFCIIVIKILSVELPNIIKNYKNDKLEKEELFYKISKYQRKYEEKMKQFIENTFQIYFDETSDMYVYNSSISHKGKIPFYEYSNFRIPKTNADYWELLLKRCLLLKCKTEKDEFKNIDDFWKSLNLNDQIDVAMNMWMLPSICTYYLSDYTQLVTPDKNGRTVEHTEDYCRIYGCWSGDCEDLGQNAILSKEIFDNCHFDNKNNRILKYLQNISKKTILMFLFAGASAKSANSKKGGEELGMHMLTILVNKSKFAERIDSTFGDVKGSISELFENESGDVLNGLKHETIPDFFIGEATNWMKGFPSDEPTNKLDGVKEEGIKEKTFMSLRKPSFYVYAFQVFTNYFIDHNINVQSFIISYKRDYNDKVIENSRSDSNIYGIQFKDLFGGSENITFIPTPEVDPLVMKLTKRFSLLKTRPPPCFLKKDGTISSRYLIDNGEPIISKKELEEILKNYSKWIVSDENILKEKKLQCLLVPPRLLHRIFKRYEKEGLFGLQLISVHSDLFIFSMWIKIN